MTTEGILTSLAILIVGAICGYWVSTRASRPKIEAARSEGRNETAAEIARLTERCFRYEESLRNAERDLSKREDDLSRASNRIGELERHNAQLYERSEALVKAEGKLADAALAIESLTNELTSQKEAVARLESAAQATAESQATLQRRVQEMTALERELRDAVGTKDAETAEVQKDNVRLQSELRAANRDLEQLRSDFDHATSSLSDTRNAVTQLTGEVNKLKATLEAERKTDAQLAEGREMLLTQFKALSAEVLDEKAKAFTEHNAKELTQLLTPMKEQFAACTTEFKEVNRIAGQERAALGEQFKTLVQQSQAVGVQAENLTKALKGDQKAQGTWGEIVLESLLELAGLVEGTHFDCQQSYKNEDEKSRSIPDVVLKLPGERHLVIDAKMSLTAYERASSCGDAAERDTHLKQHVTSVRTHIKTLAAKNYQELYKLKSLDFVLLFVPVESAFAAAVSADNQLFRDAWDKNVIVVSPSTLLFVVRTVAYLWRQETQAKNVRDIAKRGATLYDKLCGFVSDLENVGKLLNRSRDAYDDALKKLSTGDGNVIRQAQMLVELGVKPAKKLPPALLGEEIGKDDIQASEPDTAAVLAVESQPSAA